MKHCDHFSISNPIEFDGVNAGVGQYINVTRFFVVHIVLNYFVYFISVLMIFFPKYSNKKMGKALSMATLQSSVSTYLDS